MNSKAGRILLYFFLIVVSLTLFFWGLVQARSFLLPLTVAALLAMIILPVCRWIEVRGVKRAWASFFSDLIVVFFFIGLASIIAAQVDSLEDDWPQIKKRIEPKVTQLQQYIERNTGISVRQQNQRIPGSFPNFFAEPPTNDSTQNRLETAQDPAPSQDQKQQEGASQLSDSMMSSARSVISHFIGIMSDLLLIFVYIFFFLLYRRKFKLSVLKMVPQDRRDHTQKVIANSAKISQNYLFGRILLILFLAVFYSIGLSLSGVRNAILISLLAAVLSLVPYLGNVIGYMTAIVMVFISGGNITGVVGVTVTFTITQFVENYILEPYVVGSKVDLNPIFTIIVIVLGGAVWGVVGMLIAIPLLGILKVVFDNVPALQPLGYMFGEEDIEGNDQGGNNFFRRTKRWAKNKFR